MPLKIHVGPPQTSIHHGQTVLISEEDGQINWPSEKGLYFFDTRIVSSWTIYANGEPWELLNGGHKLLRIPHLPDQSVFGHPRWPDPAAYAWPHHQSVDQRRHARRP